MKLYRSMCDAELQQLRRTRIFQIGPNSVAGKYFAETDTDAIAWGIRLHQMTGVVQDKIIAITIPEELARQFHRFPMLDNIGPAYFATIDQLVGVDFEEVIV